MNISIPEVISGGELKILPEGPAKLAVEKMTLGKSQTGNPKITGIFVVMEEMPNNPPDAEPTQGEKVLETYSLLPNAVWKLNEDYKQITGERIPQGDFSEEEFTKIIKDAFEGTSWDAILVQAKDNNGKDRMEIQQKQFAG